VWSLPRPREAEPSPRRINGAPRQCVGVLDAGPHYCTCQIGMPYRAALAIVGLPNRRCNIGRGIGHSKEDDDLAAWLAVEGATIFLH